MFLFFTENLSETNNNQTTLPQIYSLYIKDAKSNKDIPVLGIKANGQYLQGVYFQQPELEFMEINNGDEISITGFSALMICCTFTNSTDTAVIKPIFEDKNGIRFIGDSITINADTETNSNGEFLSNFAKISTQGASKIKLTLMEGQPAKIYIAGA